jgi:hypothetical protein
MRTHYFTASFTQVAGRSWNQNCRQESANKNARTTETNRCSFITNHFRLYAIGYRPNAKSAFIFSTASFRFSSNYVLPQHHSFAASTLV